MPLPLFAAPEREPSSRVGFAGNIIDSRSEDRDETSLAAALADPAARMMVSRGGRLALQLNGGTFSAWHDVARARRLGAIIEEAVLLGHDGHGPALVAPGSIEPEDLPDGFKAIDHRSIYVQGLLDGAALGALAQGAALLAWHNANRHCGRCGSRTEMRIAGYKRACTACGSEIFPRTDPVAIMLAVTRERCVLGRSRHFVPGMYSALAGFIEPGETIENAVRRETFEESGIRVGRVAYHASQPWPFPHSLMIGCFGEALTEEIDPDLAELEDCRWFDRAEVVRMLGDDHPDGLKVPPPGAIASHLIRAWAESEESIQKEIATATAD